MKNIKNITALLISFLTYIASGMFTVQCSGSLKKIFFSLFVLSFTVMMFRLCCIISIKNIGTQIERR